MSESQQCLAALEGLGFTALESTVYVYLLKTSSATGYRVAKEMGRTFSTTYRVLESLERNGTDLPIRPIEEIKQEVERIVGGPPEKPRLLDVPVAVIKWVDGTVLDTVWQVADETD